MTSVTMVDMRWMVGRWGARAISWPGGMVMRLGGAGRLGCARIVTRCVGGSGRKFVRRIVNGGDGQRGASGRRGPSWGIVMAVGARGWPRRRIVTG